MCVKRTCIGNVVAKPACGIVCGPIIALFAWLISHEPAVLFSQNKPATSNQPAVLFSQKNQHQPSATSQTNRPNVMQKVIFLPKVDRKYGSNIKPRMFNWPAFRVMLGPAKHILSEKQKQKQVSKTHIVHTWIIARHSW
jgi:hypothetical protein